MTPLQHQLLNTIMTSSVIDGGHLDEAAELIVTSLISGLEIKRAGIWLDGDKNRSHLNAHLVIDHENQTRQSNLQLSRKDYPRYFSALDEEIVISAIDAPTNPLTSEFSVGYLDVLNIKSMLDAPIRQNGETVGVVCCEQMKEPKAWSDGAILFASLLADQFGRAMAAAEKISQYDQLRKTSRELDEQTNRLKALHSSLNRISLISTTDVDGIITEINDNYLATSNYSREEVIGQSHRIFQSKQQSKQFYAEMWLQLKQGLIWQGKICNLKKTGELFWLNTTISPVKNRLGQIEGYIGFSYDITGEIQAGNQLNDAEKISKMGSFRYNMGTEKWICSSNLNMMLGLTVLQTLSWTYLKKIINPNDFELLKNEYDSLENGDALNIVVSSEVNKNTWYNFRAQRQGHWIVGSCLDISTQYLQDKKLNQIIALQHTILDSANFSVVATRPDGIITHFNKMAEELLGYTAEEVINRTSPSIFHLQDEIVKYSHELSKQLNIPLIEEGFEVFTLIARNGAVDEREWTYVSKTGQLLPMSLSITAIFDENKQIVGYLGIGKDLTKQKEVERYSEQLQNIMLTAGDIAFFSGFLYDVITAEFFITNESFRKTIMTKNQQSRILLSHILEFFPDKEQAKLTDTLADVVRYGTKFDIQIMLNESNSVTSSWLQIVGTPQLNESGVVTSVVGFAQDISSQKQLEAKLSSLALTDELTNVPNRRALMARLSDEWKRYCRYKSSASVLIIDVDHFKVVNDKWGHDAGDFALKVISSTIKNMLRESDVFGRFGGEEFLLLSPDCDETEALNCAEKLRRKIESTTINYQPPMQSTEIEITITISIGICTLSTRIESLNEWLVAADKSLYLAKQSGRNQSIVYR